MMQIFDSYITGKAEGERHCSALSCGYKANAAVDTQALPRADTAVSKVKIQRIYIPAVRNGD